MQKYELFFNCRYFSAKVYAFCLAAPSAAPFLFPHYLGFAGTVKATITVIILSVTRSVASSIMAYQEEKGGKYFIICTAMENNCYLCKTLKIDNNLIII